MENRSRFIDLFDLISESEDFSRLENFKNPDAWNELLPHEKIYLAQLFFQWGCRLLEDHQDFLKCFEISSLISEEDPKVYLQQARVLIDREDYNLLIAAIQILEKAIVKNPDYFDSWYTLGLARMQAAEKGNEPENLEKAAIAFEHAENAALKEKMPLFGKLYWNWGLTWLNLAKNSEEALELHYAIEKFQQAAVYEIEEAKFWNDYGNALMKLGILIDQKELFFQAISCFEKAQSNGMEFNFDNLFNLASAYKKIFDASEQEEFFQVAEHYFTRAEKVDSSHPFLWMQWGELHLAEGIRSSNIDYFETSFTKFEQAIELEPHSSSIYALWGKAKILYGAAIGSLEALRDSEKKILKSIELAPDRPNNWSLLGLCLNELGNYFLDINFHLEAIEKFQHAISLSNNQPDFWYGLAISHYLVGEIKHEVQWIEKSVRYFQRVQELIKHPSYQFWNDFGLALMKLAEMCLDKKQVEAAIEKFQNAIKWPQGKTENGELPVIFAYNLGCAFDLLGDLTEESVYIEQAIQIFTKITLQEPDFFEAHYSLAVSYSHFGQLNNDVDAYYKANDYFQLYLGQEDDDEEAWLDWGVSLINLALIVEEESQPDKSRTYFEQAESHLVYAASLGNLQAFYQLAGLYSLTGLYDSAMFYIEHAHQYQALPSIEDVMHDDWLEQLRETAGFKEFISRLTIQQSKEQK